MAGTADTTGNCPEQHNKRLQPAQAGMIASASKGILMMHTPRSPLVRSIACLLLSLTAMGGCSTKRFTITFDMEPERVATVRVLGDAPFVLITNNGPGELHLLMQSEQRGVVDDRTIGSMVTGRTLSGGGMIKVTSAMNRTRVRIEASNAKGVAVDQSPTALRPPAPTSQPDTPPAEPTEQAEPPAEHMDDVLPDDLLDDVLDDSTGDDDAIGDTSSQGDAGPGTSRN